MATTTNYGWTTPDDTSLVKDGAAAIRTLGSSVDTTTKALNPSTTLGDIEYRSATANTNTRLGIGSTGNVLTVAGGVPTWAAPAAGGSPMTLVSTTTLSGTTTNITGISSSYNTLIMLFANVSNNAADSMNIRINTDTGSNYTRSKWRNYSGTVTYDASAVTTSFGLSYDAGTSTSGYMRLDKYDSTKYVVSGHCYQSNRLEFVNGFYNGSAAATTLSITSGSGTFSGTVYVYGA
jgi:hypothetical protein